MANSKYEYVRQFERDDSLLPNCYIVVRIDGHSFHRFSKIHHFRKPNDGRALDLMNHAAAQVMAQFPEISLSYGTSDEFSFLVNRAYTSFERRESKLSSTIVSIFTGAYIFRWNTFFPEEQLQYCPSFDSRCVLYPTIQNVRDYFSWRQVDAHINNLYNTTFWALQLVDSALGQPKLTAKEAEERLRGTFSKDKNEILFKEFGINYNNESEMFKKGSILVYRQESSHSVVEQEAAANPEETTQVAKELKKMKRKNTKVKRELETIHVDLINDAFWNKYSYITG